MVCIGFGTTCTFRHPLGDWNVFPADMGGTTVCFFPVFSLKVSLAAHFWAMFFFLSFFFFFLVNIHRNKLATGCERDCL